MHTIRSTIAILYFLTIGVIGDVAQAQTVEQQDIGSPWAMTIRLTTTEFEALEPPAAPMPAFGGPVPSVQPSRNTDRESVTNLFGIVFPWVLGDGEVTVAGATQSIPCRLRYDGDFTYTMSAFGPKRPMFVEFLDERSVQGISAMRLHSLQFDPTMMRELVAARIYERMGVPVPLARFVELSIQSENTAPKPIGLYVALEAVDGALLERTGLDKSSLLVQINGLGSLAYLGDDWTAYAPGFRSRRPFSSDEQARVIAFTKLITLSNDQEFTAQIESYLNTDAFLNYLASATITSNLTGFSSLGVNDYLCLDATTGLFHMVAAELETALGSAALSGSPDQLADLSVYHPYAGSCPLVERILKIEKHAEAYREILRQSLVSILSEPMLGELIGSLERSSVQQREREARLLTERMQQANTFGGGFGPGGGPGLGSGGPGAGIGTPPLTPEPFLKLRKASIEKQLDSGHQGFIPILPNFGMGGFSGPSRQGAEQPISNQEFLDSVRVPRGFNLSLFARSDQVNYPVAIAAEPSGAIYVASDQQGSLGTDKDGGRIYRCVDSNNDGVMDSVTTFCSVDHVRGVLYRDGSVWVCHPPYLSLFHDDNGDGIADRQQILVSGLTTELVDQRGGDHTTNGIRMGIDGWIYICAGDYGVPNAKGLDGSTVVLRGGGILRVRPDGTELELFASGLRNPFDLAIDPELNMFTRDNTNDGGGWDTRVSQIVQSAEYGYPLLFANFSDEIMPTLGVYGGGGGTGGLYIENERWPEAFNRSLFTGDWGRSAVFHHPHRPEGPTFTITQEPFVSIPRATGLDIDADGNLYLASWWKGEASVYVGQHVGFVARVTPNAKSATAFPKLSTLSSPELTDLLRRENAVLRSHVQSELIRRGNAPANIEALTEAIKDSQLPVSGRITAMFAWKQIAGQDSHRLIMELAKDSAMREFALRALTDRKSQLEGLAAEFFLPFLDDESPRVRAQALISLGRLGDSKAAEAILKLCDSKSTTMPDPDQPNPDGVIPHLAVQALVQLNAWTACLDGLSEDHWRGALRALRHMHTGHVVDELIERLGSEVDEDRRLAILVTLMRLYNREAPYDGSWWGIRPDTTGPYYDPMRWEKSDEIESVLIAASRSAYPELSGTLRKELRRHQLNWKELDLDSKTVNSVVENPIVIEPTDPNNPNQIGNLSYEVAMTRTLAESGDIQRGEKLFRSRSCAACHTAASGGQPLGPHLADIGKRYQSMELVESILKPSEKIAQGYETQSIMLETDELISGFVISENSRQIRLRDNRGITHVIDKETVAGRKRQQVSSMPDGLVDSLEPQSLADLLAYLRSL